jgi:molybdopterin-guanine dinucleotide biosynthesis protein A
MVVGVILAGGISKLGNTDLNIGNEPILCRIYDVLREVVDKVYFSVRNTYEYEFLTENFPIGDINYVVDYPDKSCALNGILSSIEQIDSKEYIIVPRDIPFIKSEQLENLLRYGRESNSTLALPIWGNGWGESLILYFNKNYCRGFIRVIKTFESRRRVTDLQRVISRVLFVPVKFLSDDPTAFYHVNCKSDLISPRCRNPVEGIVKDVIMLSRRFAARIPFIKALEELGERNYVDAVRYFNEEMNIYLERGLMQLYMHALYDALDAVSKVSHW